MGEDKKVLPSLGVSRAALNSAFYASGALKTRFRVIIPGVLREEAEEILIHLETRPFILTRPDVRGIIVKAKMKVVPVESLSKQLLQVGADAAAAQAAEAVAGPFVRKYAAGTPLTVLTITPSPDTKLLPRVHKTQLADPLRPDTSQVRLKTETYATASV